MKTCDMCMKIATDSLEDSKLSKSTDLIIEN